MYGLTVDTNLFLTIGHKIFFLCSSWFWIFSWKLRTPSKISNGAVPLFRVNMVMSVFAHWVCSQIKINPNNKNIFRNLFNLFTMFYHCMPRKTWFLKNMCISWASNDQTNSQLHVCKIIIKMLLRFFWMRWYQKEFHAMGKHHLMLTPVMNSWVKRNVASLVDQTLCSTTLSKPKHYLLQKFERPIGLFPSSQWQK